MKEYLKESISYQSTLAFIKKAHGSQKYGSEPYWTHPVSVMNTGIEIFGSKFTLSAKIAALLHDVPEDTRHKIPELQAMGYSEEIVEAVGLLTKDDTISYEANIQRIISSGNRIAMMVKYSDNWQNFHGDKSHWKPEKREASNAKYAKSMHVLGEKLGLK